MDFVTQCILTFLASFLTDIFWVFYTRRATDGHALKTSVWAVCLFLTSAIGTISWITNQWLLIPAVCGAFIGTYIAVIMDKQK